MVSVFGGISWDFVLFCVYNYQSHSMTGFLGESEVSVDAKMRFLLPLNFRKQMPEGSSDKFVINRGFENCLTIYPIEVWNPIYERVSKLSDFKINEREFKRIFLNGATTVELDSADRLLIPKHLAEYAGIKKDAILSSMGTKLELWDKDTHTVYMRQKTVDISKLAQEISADHANLFDGL